VNADGTTNSDAKNEPSTGASKPSGEQMTKSERSKDRNNQSTGASKASGDQLTKIQKRRKNDNKSKLANHHRKERALKKTAGM
jgi:hypothetical protein